MSSDVTKATGPTRTGDLRFTKPPNNALDDSETPNLEDCCTDVAQRANDSAAATEARRLVTASDFPDHVKAYLLGLIEATD